MCISLRGVDSAHIPWTTYIPWVNPVGNVLYPVDNRSYPVEYAYAVGYLRGEHISRGLHVPTGYKGVVHGIYISWVISRGGFQFNRCTLHIE